MWYISFHGGGGGTNNILVYHDSGEPHSQPNLLPTGGSNPPLQELRGFMTAGSVLYVVNGYKEYSQVLAYDADGNGAYTFGVVLASKDTVDSILHPYDLAFDAAGNWYLSSQDTNVVTGLSSTNTALPVASYLRSQFSPPAAFMSGTIVASSVGALPGTPTPPPPDVPAPQGLGVSFTDDTDTRVANSVRGVLYHGGSLYVSDEPANAVKVYDCLTGELQGWIAGDNLSAPVQLLQGNSGAVLYIGSSGNDSVVTYDLTQGAPSGAVAPTTFIDGEVKHISGMAFDADGNFYAAERKAKKIKKFPADGSGKGEDFITDLPDEPEFILYVPKGDG